MDKYLSADNIIKIALFIVGYVIAAVQSYWKSRKGRWILVEKISETQLFSKPPIMSGDATIEIRVHETPIESLIQTQLCISNTGSDITEPINVQLLFMVQGISEPATVFGVKAKGKNFMWLPPNELQLIRPFFNSTSAYRDALRVFLYSEHHLTVQVEGGGVGWQAKYIDQVQRQTKIKQAFINSLMSAIGLGQIYKDGSKKQESATKEEKWMAAG